MTAAQPGAAIGTNDFRASHGARGELCALADSLAGTIRWRMRDYEAILRAELELLAAEDGQVAAARSAYRSGTAASSVRTKKVMLS